MLSSEFYGVKFIIKSELCKQHLRSNYGCPVCHYSYGVKVDNSFFKALVSEELLLLGHILEEGGVGFPGAGTPV